MKKTIGYMLLVAGLAVVFLSPRIVFPGLERLLGIEAIVGKHNVQYLPEGGYVYTNPAAMMMWIAGVAGVGVAMFIAGAVFIRKRTKKAETN
jgi:hypothetical protein